MTDGYHEADEGLLLTEWELRDLKERWREIASLTHRLEQAIRERDEARAEVERLRAEVGLPRVAK